MELIDRYRMLLLQLLPHGRAWDLSPDGWLSARLTPIATELARLHSAADELLTEADPRLTAVMIEDWELSVGLPDDCAPLGATLGERREAVCTRLRDMGGQRLSRWRQLAEAYGYHGVTFTRLAPLVSGFECGSECAPEAVRFAWEIGLSDRGTVWFAAGVAQSGDPISEVPGGVLECIIRRDAHAQSAPLFVYRSGD